MSDNPTYACLPCSTVKSLTCKTLSCLGAWMNEWRNEQADERTDYRYVDLLGLIRVYGSGKWWRIWASTYVRMWRLARCLPKSRQYCHLGLVNFLLWGDCPVHWGTFRSFPGLYPLDASYPAVTIRDVSRHCHLPLESPNCPQLTTTVLDYFLYLGGAMRLGLTKGCVWKWEAVKSGGPFAYLLSFWSAGQLQGGAGENYEALGYDGVTGWKDPWSWMTLWSRAFLTKLHWDATWKN